VPLVEILLHGLGRLRRGMTALVITPSLDPNWIRPLSSLRPRGVGVAVCHVDLAAYAAVAAHPDGRGGEDEAQAERLRGVRSVRHALAEYDLQVHEIVPHTRLGELLVAPGPVAARRPA
jgi:hypothetical protein